MIDQMADHGHVWTASIQELGWAEVDAPADIPRAEAVVKSASAQPSDPTMVRTS
jgi:hypothetical protein